MIYYNCSSKTEKIQYEMKLQPYSFASISKKGIIDMARMFPSEPSDFNSSRAEARLFCEFKDQLPDDYAVIYSKAWVDFEQQQLSDKQGECDFIILHPARGLLFVEAKSGTKFSGCENDDFWISGKGIRITNPFKQANKNRFAVVKYLKARMVDFCFPHNIALAFPEAQSISLSGMNAIRPEMLILVSDLDRLRSKVEVAINAFRGSLKNPVSNNQFKRIIELIRAKCLITTSLQVSLDALDEPFFQLRDAQIRILNQFEKNKRVIVEGCAGTGKTLLAVEKARRASQQGKSVLMLCYNQPLAVYLKRRLREHETDADVFSFHELCESVITRTGGRYEPDRIHPSDFYDCTAPRLLAEHIPRFAKRYDLIIVDEAQDFMKQWWAPLTCLLQTSRGSEFYIFRDPDQNIFRREISQPFEDVALFSLDQNCRNTPAIIRWINKRCQTKIEPPAKIQEGVDPAEIHIRDDEQELKETGRIIDQLVHKEKISPRKIVILGKHPRKDSTFKNVPAIGGLDIVEDAVFEPNEEQIRYSSVYRFKGLESDCVLLTGIGRQARADIREDSKAVLLTGASRARKLLYIFHRNSLHAKGC
jgi:hypothetical protein